MLRTCPAYPHGFRQKIVDLYRAGRRDQKAQGGA